MLIHYSVGQKMLAQLEKGVDVSVIGDFDFPKQDKVEYQIWLSSDNDKSYDLINDFR